MSEAINFNRQQTDAGINYKFASKNPLSGFLSILYTSSAHKTLHSILMCNSAS